MIIIRGNELFAPMVYGELQRYGIEICQVTGCSEKAHSIIKDLRDNDGDYMNVVICYSHLKHIDETQRIYLNFDFTKPENSPNKIGLEYGHNIAGINYYLTVGGKQHLLGRNITQDEAKIKAKNMVIELKLDPQAIDSLTFKSNENL